MEIESDLKSWYALSCPTTGVRFDLRTLELMDTDHDGHVRTPEVCAALAFLESKGVTREMLKNPTDADRAQLAEITARAAALDREPPSAAEKQALADWEAKGAEPEIAVCGAATAAADAALAAVEKTIDDFFTPPDDLPLVTEEPDRDLPLRDHLNPRHLEAILAFADACVVPFYGAEKATLSRLEWKAVKAKFAPYRAWRAAKPVRCAAAKTALEEEERLVRYRLYLGEFLENYVTMDRLYGGTDDAIFQTGVLRIDGRELNLCFHVENEAAHAALAEKSKCCVIYLKLSRAGEAATRGLCAVVTAGTVNALYAGRNGVFYDRDGKDWAAVVTKVVENQVSLTEAFWAPWRKVGEGIGAAVKKFLGDRQATALASVQKGTTSASAGGAALASSVAAIGIGLGMVGAAFASVMAAVSSMTPLQLALSLVAIVLIVSLPSVILTWFKLRQRDLGAILNAGGWAINRRMRFSMKRARGFTTCAKDPLGRVYFVGVLLVLAALVAGVWYANRCRPAPCPAPVAPQAAAPAAPQA